MDRRAWRATVHGVTKSRTRLSDQHSHKGEAIVNELPHFPSGDPLSPASVDMPQGQGLCEEGGS